MSVDQFLIFVLSGVTTGLGWFARELYQATQRLRDDLSALEVRLSTNYVSYDRLRDLLEPIKEGIDDIKRTLHQKQDKP
jgi:hypothetical protein